MKKRVLCAMTAAVLALSMLAGCGSNNAETTSAAEESSVEETEAKETEAESTEADADKVTVRIGAMSGPTAMGLVKLMADNEEGLTENNYEFADLATEASAMVTPLAQGELDIAAVPANLASTRRSRGTCSQCTRSA